MLENLNHKIGKKRIAIVLFNLGGPDSLKSVKQFLFNLFYDKAIINLPNPFRFFIAKIISITRNKKSQHLYSLIGNKSPLLEETESQRLALTQKLKETLKEELEIFISMRYSNPSSRQVIEQINQYDPTDIILLPLYPQFSTTTTGSSIKDFMNSFHTSKVKDSQHISIKTICCYPFDNEFITSHVSIIKESLANLKNKENYRILFSAHGLPLKIIKAGDPYQWQIEKTVENIVYKLQLNDLDYRVSYQSRVGPVEWLGPNTEDEIDTAAREGKSIIVVPVAFISEHVETLVELDIEYRDIANKYGVEYIRVPALGMNKFFINSLSNMVISLINQTSIDKKANTITSSNNKRICPSNFPMCLCNTIK